MLTVVQEAKCDVDVVDLWVQHESADSVQLHLLHVLYFVAEGLAGLPVIDDGLPLMDQREVYLDVDGRPLEVEVLELLDG